MYSFTGKIDKKNIFSFLILLLIFSTSFQNLLTTPYFGNKVQLTEIVFPFALFFLPYGQLMKLKFTKGDKSVFLFLFLYLVVNTISSLRSSALSSVIESAGRVYLAVLFSILIIYFKELSADEFRKTVSIIFFHMGWVLSLLSLSGYALLFFHIDNPFIYKFEEYPYLGTIYRLKGPTFTPSMLITILSCCLFFSIAGYQFLPFRKVIRKLMILIILLACILTFSKTFIMTCWGLGVWGANRYFKLTKSFLLISIVPVVFFLFFTTHFVFVKRGSPQYEKYIQTNFVSDKIAFSAKGIDALETCYFLNKKIALEIATKNPFIGIGAGNFNDELDLRKQKGLYPLNFLSYDPHSTYFGALAENGVIGLSVLIAFILLIFLRYTAFQKISADSFYRCIFLLLAFFLIEAISTDIMNFRHYWAVLAVAVAYYEKLPIKI